MTKEKWITTSEAAARLKVTTARIRQLVADGSLSAQKMGTKYRGQWLVSASEVNQRLTPKGVPGTMRVKNRMTHSPITATTKTTYTGAMRLMKNNHIQHLPILDKNDQLVGIVAHSDMLRVEPSPATTLSVYEMVSLLDQITMDKVMQHPVYAVDEDCTITNAAKFMLEHNIGCLPVMRSGNNAELVGIITDTDIFKTFVEITGGDQAGSRIQAKLPDEKGQLAPFTQAFSNSGSNIVSVAITYDDTGEYAYVDLKERGGDEAKIKSELEKLGNVEIVEFRPSDEDELLSFGK